MNLVKSLSEEMWEFFASDIPFYYDPENAFSAACRSMLDTEEKILDVAGAAASAGFQFDIQEDDAHQFVFMYALEYLTSLKDAVFASYRANRFLPAVY